VARSRVERLGRWRGREGKKERERGGGVRPRECHAVQDGVVGPGTTGGRHPDCVPAGRDPDAARAGGASLFGQWRTGADVGGPRWK
jgi:hypothetical protein